MSTATTRFFRGGFAFWSVLALVAFANGALLVPLLESVIGESAARPLGSLTFLALAYPLIALFFGYVERLDGESPYWLLGAVWAVLTLAFDGILFVGILQRPLADVAGAFTLSGLLEGNLFALELIMLLVAPALFSLVARRKRQAPLRRSGLPAE